jgi:Zn ribbon nucleic-acid-binding protein
MKKFLLLTLAIIIVILAKAQPANDNFASATLISHTSNNCSADAQYTTIGATSDGIKGSCWENGANYDVWFKFVATTTSVTLDLKVNGTEGTMRHPNMALWESDGTTEISCVRRLDANTDVQISQDGLVIGNTYYVSVDNYVGLSYQGTFTLCIDDQATYDQQVGAITIVHTSNNCSADAAYSTIHATADGLKGSCWENGPNYTRWFKFVATSANVTLDLKVDGAEGTMRHPNMALWESDGITELNCVRRIDADTDVQISHAGLVVGNTYYVTVDNYVGLNYRGTFTLCIDDQVTYDQQAGAITLVHTSNNCSADAAYSTIYATADGLKGSCWENGPNYTRWFKFVATSANVTLDLKVDGTEGTMRHPNMALWESDGITELNCVRRLDADTDVQISHTGLVVGNTYYITVDNYVGLSYRGTFTLCIDDQATYDQQAGAITIIHTSNNCSADAAYSTINATSDGIKGSCWENGPNYTRWFKFVATSANVTLDLKVDGAEGTMRHPNMALWESDGITEVNCVRRLDADTDVQISHVGLVVGNTYYITVDNYVGLSYRGTFTLCIDDQATYDQVAGAKELTNLNNWCSADAAYSTINATSDGIKGSCWENGPNYTRWFKFTAISNNVTLQMKVNGTEGTMRHPNMALWESDAITEVGCVKRINATTDVSLSSAALVVGNVYYISCDNYVGLNYRGTFTLCIDNVDVDYYSIADGVWNDGANWSIVSYAGPAAASYPDAGDIAHIQDNIIDVNGAAVCAEIELNTASSATKLNVNATTMTVAGQVTMTNSGNDFDSEINITGGGDLSINDKLILSRDGGANAFNINIANNSTVSIGDDFEINSTSGSINNNQVILNGNAQLTVDQDLKMNNTGGVKTFIQLNGTSVLTVSGNTEITAAADDKNEIELNNTANLIFKGNVNRSATPYGILTSNDNSKVTYSAVSQTQVVAGGGSGTGDTFQYQSLEINNSHITVPQLVVVGGEIAIPGELTLTDGVVETSSSNLLILNNGSITTGGSVVSFVSGPLRKVGLGAYTFHVGNNEDYAPVGITSPSNAVDFFTAEYYPNGANPAYNTSLKEVSIDHVGTCEYWTIDQVGTSNVSVTLSWQNARSCEITDLNDLIVTRWDGAEWKNHGNGGTIGGSASGSIITLAPVTSFSPFTLGSISTENPLPIELVNFVANSDMDKVNLSWVTASEINNEYFDVEKSSDGKIWSHVVKVPGAGNSSQMLEYFAHDFEPIDGVSYYRLKQTDFDGTATYSKVVAVKFDKNGDSQVLIYPNPTNDKITIVGSESELSSITIFNIQGKDVGIMTQISGNDARSKTVDLSELKPGIYFVKTSTTTNRLSILK